MLTTIDWLLTNAVYWLSTLGVPDGSQWRSRLVWVLINAAFFPTALLTRSVHKVRASKMERIMSGAIWAILLHGVIFLSLEALLDIRGISWRQEGLFYLLYATALLVWWPTAHSIIKMYRRRGGNIARVLIVGCGQSARRLYDEMMHDEGFGYSVVGFIDLWCPPDFPHKRLYLGNFDQLQQIVETNAVDEVYYAPTGEREDLLMQTLRICDKHMAQFRYVPQLSRYLSHAYTLDTIGQMPVLTMRRNPLQSPVNAALKRAMDIAVSGLFLIVSPVIFIPVAIAIKCSSPGPVFFRQRRTGYKGTEFWCLKFRTMRVNADADTLQATAHDPRKTRLGDLLRRTSIDELPQFINVFTGDMSVVGPRPHMLKHTEDYSRLIDQYMVRHLVKPGITGWAQVRGYRGQTEELWQMEKRVEHDIWYIEHWTLWLDLKIIIRTVINAIAGEKNAF